VRLLTVALLASMLEVLLVAVLLYKG
jgi:hypothetical protein